MVDSVGLGGGRMIKKKNPAECIPICCYVARSRQSVYRSVVMLLGAGRVYTDLL